MCCGGEVAFKYLGFVHDTEKLTFLKLVKDRLSNLFGIGKMMIPFTWTMKKR